MSMARAPLNTTDRDIARIAYTAHIYGYNDIARSPPCLQRGLLSQYILVQFGSDSEYIFTDSEIIMQRLTRPF